MKIKKPLLLVASILISQMAGIIGSIFTTSAIPTWYEFLNKPTFNPPNWVFGPVWIILYTLMGISIYRIWIKKANKNNEKIKLALQVFGIQLFLNALWSVIFFGLQNLGLALLEIIILWLVILYLIKLFWKIDKTASYLLIPYILWVSFAAILNYSIWNLNKPPINTYAQETTGISSYDAAKDDYSIKLEDFNNKKSAYLKNTTLSLKEELRVSLYNLLISRNNLINGYLTYLKAYTNGLNSLSGEQKENSKSLIDSEISWFNDYKNNYQSEDSVESLLQKSVTEDERINMSYSASVDFVLVNAGLGEITQQRNSHKEIYDGLKSEAQNLVSLGRADSSLFDRWFSDIEGEFNNFSNLENEIIQNLKQLRSEDDSEVSKGQKDAYKNLDLAKQSLIKINNYLYELENVVEAKR